MRKYLNQISNLLNKKQIILLSISSLLLLIVTILETVGLGSIAGFIYLVSDPDLIISKLPDGTIKDFIISKDINSIIFLSLIILIIFFIFKNLLIIFYHYWSGLLKKNVNTSNSQRLLKYYFSKNYSFFIENSSQKLINNLDGEIKRSTHYLFFTLILIKEVLLIFSLLITLLFVSWKLSSTLFVILGFFSLIFYFIFKKYSKKLGESITKMSESILKNLSESIYNAKLIKLFDIKKFFIKKIVSNIEKRNTSELHQSIINLLPRFILEIIAVSMVASIICYFVLNDYTFQSIISLITLMSLFIVRLVPAFTSINTARGMLKFYETSFLNISKQLAEESFVSIKDNERENIPKIEFESIKVKNLSHKYMNQHDLFLKDINFEVVKGDTVAIIGETGAGKSTLINILLGLINPNEGEMIFNKKNVYENIYDWQSLIGYVPQDTHLMNESIKNNVAFGLNKDLINKDQLDYSLSKANIKTFIDTLENGVETICGDNGINFSGGQRQRIGIARALYRDPQILIFDESTSSLDIDTEKELLGDLFALDKKTIIIVSHRLNIIKNCNKILLLKSGKVLDFGRTDEVAKRNNYLLSYI